MPKGIFDSWAYVIWYAFYLGLFSLLTLGAIIPLYMLLLFMGFLPVSERLWRWVSGIRPLRLRAEKMRLIPLFEEVYDAYLKEEKETRAKKIKLHIQESMSINAFAFGRETLVLTKVSIDLLSDEALKGLMAHELAHFHNYHTRRALFAYIINLPFSLLMTKLRKIDSSLSGFLRFFFNIFFAVFRLIEFAGDLILMHHSRKQEFRADMSAMSWGFGEELTGVLIQLYQISMEKPKSVKEMLKATHPHITKRIERLETVLYVESY